MVNWTTLLAVCAIVVFHQTNAQYPGARLTLTSKALNYGNMLYECGSYIWLCMQMCSYIFDIT